MKRGIKYKTKLNQEIKKNKPKGAQEKGGEKKKLFNFFWETLCFIKVAILMHFCCCWSEWLF